MEKEKIKEFLKSKENLILILLMSFAIIFRLVYFFKLGNQPIWWDEADYLVIAKTWISGTNAPEWLSHFTGMRPLFLPLIWALFFKLGFGELTVRFFTLFLPSIATIYLTFLLGRDLFNKKIGLISALMMSVYWVFFFYSFRLLTDIFSVFLGMLSLYFFWSYYIKKQKPLGIYLAVFFGVLAFSTRFALALVLIMCAIYLIFVKKFSMFKDKTIWKSLGIFFLCISPYIIYFISTKFYLFQFYFGEKAVSIKNPIAWNIIPMIFGTFSGILNDGFLHNIWGISFLIGLIALIPNFLAFDIFWKQKNKSLNSTVFVFLWILVHLFFYIVIFRAANDRWLLMLMPAIFFIASNGIMKVYAFSKKHSKYLAIILLLILLFGGAYQNLTHAINLTELKKESYGEVKDGALWLKENTPLGTKVITSSIVQNQYYSERQSEPFSNNETIWSSCSDLYGAISTNETCQRLTEASFNKKMQEYDPDYLVVSIFEPVFTPQWAYTYTQRHNLTAVAAFPQNTQQPNLVIYRF